jgi:purine-binding chemotaxis protein CheW
MVNATFPRAVRRGEGGQRPGVTNTQLHNQSIATMSTTITETAQYITFKLGDESFAINVAQVREVLELPQITKVPTAPDYMRGVVNVRGKAIPVVDLRLKFGLPAAADTVHSRIVVLELELDGETTVVGGIADSVHEVIELESGQINPPPRIAMRWRTELIQGMGRRGDEFIIILDIQQVFISDAVALMENTASATAGVA